MLGKLLRGHFTQLYHYKERLCTHTALVLLQIWFMFDYIISANYTRGIGLWVEMLPSSSPHQQYSRETVWISCKSPFDKASTVWAMTTDSGVVIFSQVLIMSQDWAHIFFTCPIVHNCHRPEVINITHIRGRNFFHSFGSNNFFVPLGS